MPASTSEGRGPGRPRDPHTHDAILTATCELLLAEGYAGLTLEHVARRARVGKATIYRWWDSKLELVLEATAPHLRIGVVPDTGDTRRDLRVAVDQLVSTYADPLAAIVIFVVVADLEQDQRLRTMFRSDYVLPWRSSLAAALRRGVRRGDLAADLDVDLAVDVVAGTVFQRVLVVPEPRTEGLADALVGLVAGEPPRRPGPDR